MRLTPATLALAAALTACNPNDGDGFANQVTAFPGTTSDGPGDATTTGDDSSSGTPTTTTADATTSTTSTSTSTTDTPTSTAHTTADPTSTTDAPCLDPERCPPVCDTLLPTCPEGQKCTGVKPGLGSPYTGTACVPDNAGAGGPLGFQLLTDLG